MNYLFQKQLSPVESTGLNFGGKSATEYDSQYSLVLKDLSYNGKATKGAPLTVSEFEGNFAFIADQARQNKAAVDELSFTVNNLGSATNAVKMIGKLTGADLNIDHTSFPYINVNIGEVGGYGDTVNFISGETLSIYFPVSDVTAQVRLVEVRDGISGSGESMFTSNVKALVWENLPEMQIMFPDEDMTNVTITGLDSGIVVPFVSMGDYVPSTIQTITFDESGVYVITDILMTNASTSIETAENGMFLSIDPNSMVKDEEEKDFEGDKKPASYLESAIIAITNDEDGSSLQMLSNSNNFINTMVGAGNSGRLGLGLGGFHQIGQSTSTTGGIQLFGNTLVSNEMYFVLETSEGSAATCDIYVFGYKISDVSTSNSAQAKAGA